MNPRLFGAALLSTAALLTGGIGGCGLASSGASADVGANLEWEVDLIKVGLE